jgi:uncharacterized RDD family membrane protein YckC
MTLLPDYSISTPENVDLHLELAGLGNRIVACLIDTILTYIAILVLALPSLLYPRIVEALGAAYSDNRLLVDTLVIALYVLGSFLIFFGYYIFFETIWQGQTPGKKLMGIRVVDSLGQPVTVSSIWIRNLLRPIDQGAFLLGLLVMLIDRNERRLGDLAANTIVIRERLSEKVLSPFTSEQGQNLDEIDAGLITLPEYEMLTNFLKRRKGMPTQHRVEAAKKLAEHFASSLHVPDGNAAPESFLERIFLAYRARAEDALNVS